ncbi:nitronate monooxygenase [Nocardia tenerifensis]|uniref:Nitronate monooxygenase n=1 Tax=Nocardia tenerifensis TaxID=228006 RepID=A0A318JYR7_9NOCA|nr:nitronate monooxygenase [Nocardia tenerifensis]PXX59238.1 nitronate monooxygenase [Nocardia tenerifensis]
MSLRTALTELFDLRHPIMLAPMGGVAGGELAAAVSNAGGLGMIGSGDRAWLERELAIVADKTRSPWGVGFLSWAVDHDTIRWVLDEYRPRAVMLSFGDPRPFADAVRAAGATLMVQVTDHDEARRAVEAGAEVIVAQGGEAGGHGAGRSTMTIVPTVADLVHPTPVLAAGGIADGRGLAAALTLGAAGAMIGTRFEATHEAVLSAEEAKAIVAARGDDTSRNRVFDIARRSPWPTKYTARMLRNPFFDRWQDREDELRADTTAQDAYLDAVQRQDPTAIPVWAGEGVDLITAIEPAADVLTRIAAEADAALARAARRHVDDL